MKSSVRLHTLFIPVVAIAALGLSRCEREDLAPPPAPPGGTYLSTSAGASFAQSVVIEGQSGTYIASLPLRAIHRPLHSPGIIYIAAGEVGIVTSHTDGASWRIMATPLSQTLDVVLLSTGVVVASGVDGIGQGYIIRSLDGGQTWEDVLTIPLVQVRQRFSIIGGNEPPAPSVLISLEPDPFSSDRIYAGSNLGTLFIGEQAAKVWRSYHTVSASGSAIGKLLPSPHRRGQVLVITGGGQLLAIHEDGTEEHIRVPRVVNDTPAKADGDERVLDVSFIEDFPQALIVSLGDGVVATRDAGASWFRFQIPAESAAKFNTVVARVSPTNTNRILVAINNVLYRSEDGGRTWITGNLNMPNFVVTDVSINPANAARILLVVRPLAI